jgi:cytochrome c biogenesis protein CcdA
MPRPEESLEHPKHSRSLGIALGVTEYLFILGLLTLATGISLVFGGEWAAIVIGAVMIVTAFYNAMIG